MRIALTSDAADSLEAAGEAVVVLGLAWAVSRAAPSMRRPLALAGLGLGMIYTARQFGEQRVYGASLQIPVDDDGDVIELTPERVTVTQ